MPHWWFSSRMNNDLRDTDEQKEMRLLWSPAGKSGPTTACPCCCPNITDGRKSAFFFERGTVPDANGNPLVAMRCNNCGYIRCSKPKAKDLTKPAASVERALRKARRFFEGRGDNTITKWEVKSDERGGWWLVAQTGGNVFIASGAHIHIGPRGSMEVWSIYDLRGPEGMTELKKHFAFMLDCKVR